MNFMDLKIYIYIICKGVWDMIVIRKLKMNSKYSPLIN